jgi:hypothetical protein
VSRTGILALRRLTLLQEFVFGDRSEELVLKHCLELLPHLHIIGNRLEATQSDHGVYEYEMMMKMGKALSQIEAPCTLQLHHLWLHGTVQILDKISLPELQVLELCETIAMHPWLFGGLPKLTELYLYNMNQDTLMPVLAQVGRQLQVLLIELIELPRLDLVLEACPNLTQLHVYTEMGPRHTSQLRPDMLKQLKAVKFDAASDYLEPGLLFQILSMAPELRSIELGSLRVDEDWEALAELVEEGTCMRHLETIRIERGIFFTELEQSLMAKVCVSCIINCPQLKIYGLESHGNVE